MTDEVHSSMERPMLSSGWHPESRKGFKEWAAHVDAGRIGAHVGKAEAEAGPPAAPAIPATCPEPGRGMRTFGLNSPEAYEFFTGRRVVREYGEEAEASNG